MRPRVKAIYQGARVGYCSRAGGRDMCSFQAVRGSGGVKGEGEGEGAKRGEGEGVDKGGGGGEGGRGSGGGEGEKGEAKEERDRPRELRDGRAE